MQEHDSNQLEVPGAPIPQQSMSGQVESGMYMSSMIINEQTDDDKKFTISLVDRHDQGNVENVFDNDSYNRQEFLGSLDVHGFTEMLVISQIRNDYHNDDPFLRHVFTIEKAIHKAIRNIVLHQHMCESKEHFNVIQSQMFRCFYQDISVGFITSTGQLKSTAYIHVNNSLVESIDQQQYLLQFKKSELKITTFFASADSLSKGTLKDKISPTLTTLQGNTFSSMKEEEKRIEIVTNGKERRNEQIDAPSTPGLVSNGKLPNRSENEAEMSISQIVHQTIKKPSFPPCHSNMWMKQAFIRTDKFRSEFIQIQKPQDEDLKSGISIHFVYRPIDDQIYAVKKSCLTSLTLTFYDVFSTMYLQEQTSDHRKIREAKILAKLTHPNVLRLYDWWIEEERSGLFALYMQLEYCSFPGFKHQTNDLLNFSYYYLNPMNNKEKVDNIKIIMNQIVDGLEYIHNRGIVHRDLKPENIFVTITVSGELQVMLADFDQGKDVREIKLSTICDEKISDNELNSIRSRNTIQSGTSGYQTPNSNKDKAYDQCDEFYALGITLLHLVLTFPGEPKNRNHYATTFGMSEIQDVLLLFDNWANKFVKNKHKEFNFECFVQQMELAKKLLDKRVKTHDQIRQIIQSW